MLWACAVDKSRRRVVKLVFCDETLWREPLIRKELGILLRWESPVQGQVDGWQEHFTTGFSHSGHQLDKMEHAASGTPH